MRNLTCEQVQAELPALALDALEQGDRAAVLAHLDLCEGCRRQYAEFAEIALGLAVAVPQRVPPPGVKQALMARLQPAPAPARRLDHLGARMRAAWRSPQRGWVLALAAALVVAGALAVEVVRLQTEHAALAARLEQQIALAALVGRDVQVVSLVGKPAAANASAKMRFVPDGRVGVLETRDLPPLSPSQAYQLWLIYPDGTRDSGAVFSVPGDGSATVVVMAPQPFGAYARFGVSIEPAGGSPAPTGPAALGSS